LKTGILNGEAQFFSEFAVIPHQIAAMDQSPHDVLFHHADRDAETAGNLTVLSALDLVEQEDRLAGGWQFVQKHRQPHNALTMVERPGRIFSLRKRINILEIDTIEPFGILLSREINGRVASGCKNVGLRMLDQDSVRTSAGETKVGILHDLFAAVPIAHEARGKPDKIAMVPTVDVREPVIEITHAGHSCAGEPVASTSHRNESRTTATGHGRLSTRAM